MESRVTPQDRVLVLMPTPRDAERTVQVLGEAAVACVPCWTLAQLVDELRAGAGALLVTDELLMADVRRPIADFLRQQPAWSALPVLVLAREGAGERIQGGILDGYGNVVVLERPVRTRSLVSAVLSALRARRTQYQIRDALQVREQQAMEIIAQGEKLRIALDTLSDQAEQLRVADRLKDEFLATLAHELRNPLAPISTGLALLVDPSISRELSRKTLGIMERQVKHMVRLIDDLLDVSRITRGKLDLKRERIAVKTVLDAAVEGSMPKLARGGHRLVSRITDEPLHIDADLTRAAQIVGNLLDNASKYTPAGGVVELSARRDGNEVVIAVADNGLGIPPEHLDDIFAMFGQVNRALDQSQGGLGIGLALVRKLVEMHGGTVVAESPGRGRGSVFTVRLPLSEEAPAAAARPAAPEPRHEPAQKQVLLVDDNSDAVELLAVMLEQVGYATTAVQDGPAAITAARSLTPDVVILDIGLPGMNGYEVAEAMRRDPALTDTALIALTGWGSLEDRRRAFAAGFDLHLTKPVTPEDLEVALGRAARLRGRHPGSAEAR